VLILGSVIFFLLAAMILYCLFGGADFGAGILEIFSGPQRKSHRSLVEKAIGPVWEANHVWLIVGLVILFNGFPAAFQELSISFHIPMVLLLIGIVLRGCAFSFRSYDPGPQTSRSQWIYSFLFVASSLITPFFFGVLVAAVLFGKLNTTTWIFWDRFVMPWLTPFSFSVGFFMMAMFAFIAAVYLVVEAKTELVKSYYRRMALFANLVMLVTSVAVFVTAGFGGLRLIDTMIFESISLLCLICACVCNLLIWVSLGFKQDNPLRAFAVGEIIFIISAWMHVAWPVLIACSPTPITFFSAAAPDETLKLLSICLIVGSGFIFPGLFLLIAVFKFGRK